MAEMSFNVKRCSMPCVLASERMLGIKGKPIIAVATRENERKRVEEYPRCAASESKSTAVVGRSFEDLDGEFKMHWSRADALICGTH
jgi:uncharacterized protein with ATP-grasp and redox domains